MIEIKVPTLGESITTARIGKILVAVGDQVAADQNIILLETEKISLEVTSPVDGVIKSIKVAPGQDVAVGAVLAELGVSDTNVTVAKKSIEPEIDKTKRAVETTAATDKPKPITNKPVSTQPVVATIPSYSPPMKTNRALDERGEERVKMSNLRQVVARRLKMAQNTAAILTTFNEVDMEQVIQMRNLHKDQFEKKHGTRLGFMSFFVKATSVCLKEFPALNAEIDGDEIIYKNFCDIGIAVGSPQGLVVPVLRDAEKKSFAEIELAISDFGNRARLGQLNIQDLTGGSFTITNGGIYGSMLSTPILNPPQSGILGMHKITERAVVKNGVVAIAPIMYLALSYDHRIVDGREAVSFLSLLKNLLEYPERLMLNI